MIVAAIVEERTRAGLCRGDSGVVAAPRHIAPPCVPAFPRLLPARCRPGSGYLFEPVGVMQPAEDRGADDLGSLRQSMQVDLGLDREAFSRVGYAGSEAQPTFLTAPRLQRAMHRRWRRFLASGCSEGR